MRLRKIFCKSLGVQVLLLSIMGIFGYNVIVSAEDAEDWIPDPNLRIAVRQALKIDTDTPLTQADMAQLINLDTNRFQVTDKISNLKGLEYAVNLKLLIVAQNRIQDLRPLADLTKLTFLIWEATPFQIFRHSLDLSVLRCLDCGSTRLLIFHRLQDW